MLTLHVYPGLSTILYQTYTYTSTPKDLYTPTLTRLSASGSTLSKSQL
jgi:hypothetical protein